MALRFAYVAAVAAGSSPASTPASPASSSNLEKLQALVNQLAKEPVKEPEPVPALRPAPEPQRKISSGSAPGVMRVATQGAGSMPNAESDSSVLVFDEAEKSVERALRRLQPSPAASASRQLPQPSTYCTECDFFFNGATDSAGADMCKKPEANKKFACFAKYTEGCPFDMESYVCAGNAPSSPPPPEPDGCHASRMIRYRALSAENEALMATYLQLKMDEMQMIEDAITYAERDSYCQCSPIETVSSILGVA